MKYTSIRLEITSACNLDCQYCHNKDYANKENDLNTDEILKLIKNINQNNSIKKVLLTGGEPLMQKDIVEIISQLTNWGIKVDMVTNGISLTEKRLKELEDAGLKRIRLSIDEVEETSTLRKGSIPQILWNKAKMIKEKSNIELCVHTVCSPANVNQLVSIYRKLIEIGAERWRVFELGHQGGSIENKKIFDFDSYYGDYINETKKIIKEYIQNHQEQQLDIEINNIFKTSFLKMQMPENIQIDWKAALKQKEQQSPCNYVTDHQLTIRSDGKATLCQYFHNAIYDFKENNFNLEKTEKNKRICVENEIKMKDLKYCMNCKYLFNCNSGCRSRAKFLTNDILDADPVACYLFPLIRKEIMTLLPSDIQKAYEMTIRTEFLEPKYSQKDLERFLEERGYSKNG